jgi:hypothetical protein
MDAQEDTNIPSILRRQYPLKKNQKQGPPAKEAHAWVWELWGQSASDVLAEATQQQR